VGWYKKEESKAKCLRNPTFSGTGHKGDQEGGCGVSRCPLHVNCRTHASKPIRGACKDLTMRGGELAGAGSPKSEPRTLETRVWALGGGTTGSVANGNNLLLKKDNQTGNTKKLPEIKPVADAVTLGIST